MASERKVPVVNQVITEFLNRKNLQIENPAWALGESPLGEIGVFAARDIPCGEEIFQDFPIIDGPKVKETDFTSCVVCYKHDNVEPCRNKCGLPICSEICYQNHKLECEFIRRGRGEADGIDTELFRILTPLRCLQLDTEDKAVIAQLKHHKGFHHGFEVDKLKDKGVKFEEEEEDSIRIVCCVMDANAFEVSIETEGKTSNFRGLYPLAGLVNHSCVPNLTHGFDKNKKMIVKACTPIKKGEELFHSYVTLMWSTPTRQFKLVRSKHFTCKCPRCLDPTEFGTYMSAILCKKCRGNVMPKNPLSFKSNWICEDCKTEVAKQNVACLLSTLGSVLRSFDDDDIDVMLKFLNLKLTNLVHAHHEIVVSVKYKIAKIIGHHEKYKLRDIDSKLLDMKTKICDDLIKLTKNLKIGEMKFRGILAYELFTCLKEKSRRESLSQKNFVDESLAGEAEIYFKEACSILTECGSALESIKI